MVMPKYTELPGSLLIRCARIILGAAALVVLFVLLLRRLLQGLPPLPPSLFVGPAIFCVYGIAAFVASAAPNPSRERLLAAVDMALITLCVLIGGNAGNPGIVLSIAFFVFMIFLPLWGLSRNIPAAICAVVCAVLGHALACLVFRSPLGGAFFSMLVKSAFLLIVGILGVLGMSGYESLLRDQREKQGKSFADASIIFTKTLNLVKTIQESAEAISLSSRDNFAAANSQAAGMEEIKTTINDNIQIAVEISDKTGSVANIAAKMEDDVLTGFSVLEKNVKKMGDIREKNSGVINGIISLGNKIIKIRDIVRVINTITDQTKVIAFNADLEAAGAGETGKRFAVVAAEVNRLADDIAGLTRQIRDQVEEIQNSSSSLIISSEEGSDRIAEGYKLIKDLEDIFKEIRSGAEITSNQAQTITISTQKQRKSSEQINVAITDISRSLETFIRAAERAAASAEGLAGFSRDLEEVLNREQSRETHGN
jgi:methyl-accepting chemotaxis protein